MARLLGNFSDDSGDIGMILGADGAARLFPGLVRIPDVSFTGWDRLPAGVVPRQPLLVAVPDLAVEVLSPGNTKGEMARKPDDYFRAGARLVWVVDPVAHTVVLVHTAPGESIGLSGSDALIGGDVLPGFRVPVAKLFEELPQAKPKRGK